MKGNEKFIKELTENQRRVYVDAVQLYEAYLEAMRERRSYTGGMRWKTVKGRDYLYRYRDRLGHGKSLGPRSAESEKILADFRRKKEQSEERLSSLRQRLSEQARFCKAALLGRVPRVVTNVVRILEQHGLMGRNLTVVGTNALFAYEAAAGTFFDRPITATTDMDILWDTRSKLTLVSHPDIIRSGLLGLLQKTDRSFEASRAGGFRAVNKDGYMVELIKPLPKPPWKPDPRSVGDAGDLVAAEIPSLQWLVSSPKFTCVVIGEDGFPARMVVPDPRAFAVHKLWLSRQRNRDPVKKNRDHAQAVAVASLILRYLPQYPFQEYQLRMFPKEVMDGATAFLKDLPTAAGLDLED